MIHSAAAPNTAGGATGESFPNILAGCIPQARWSNRFTNQPPESSPRQGKDRWPAWVMESRPRQKRNTVLCPGCGETPSRAFSGDTGVRP